MKRPQHEFRPTVPGLLLAGLVMLGSGYVVGQELAEDRSASVDSVQPAAGADAAITEPC